MIQDIFDIKNPRHMEAYRYLIKNAAWPVWAFDEFDIDHMSVMGIESRIAQQYAAIDKSVVASEIVDDLVVEGLDCSAMMHRKFEKTILMRL